MNLFLVPLLVVLGVSVVMIGKIVEWVRSAVTTTFSMVMYASAILVCYGLLRRFIMGMDAIDDINIMFAKEGL